MTKVTMALEYGFPLGTMHRLTGWSIELFWRDDEGTFTVREEGVTEEDVVSAVQATRDEIERLRQNEDMVALQELAVRIVARMQAEIWVRDETVTDPGDFAAIFFPWEVGVAYSVGNVRTYEGEVFECLQGHTSQADWTPPETPTLWKAHRPVGAVTAWVQPQGAHDAYHSGDRVSHNGTLWTSAIDNNVWEPGVHGWIADG